MITYTFLNSKTTVDQDGVQDRISYLGWRASKTEGTVTGTIGPRGTNIPLNYAPADKRFADVTEQDCIDWVTDLEDQNSIDAQCQAQIDLLTAPVTTGGLPWDGNTYPLWAVGVQVVVGYVCSFQGTLYECVQAHTTQSDWAPPATPALWRVYTTGPQLWIQPTGAHNDYDLGEQVIWTELDRHLWTSLVDANVWEPGTNATLWQDEGPY